MVSESTEMYLITVYRLTTRQSQTTVRELADHLGVALSSTSEKVRTLTEQGYLDHAWREGISLTDLGWRIALQVLRKNRLAATFLIRLLDYSLEEALDESCDLEHAISSRLTLRLERFLGNPTVDPYGQPIPTSDGSMETQAFPYLINVPVGSTVKICRLDTMNGERLAYLQSLGILPGVIITVQEVAPFEGPLMIALGKKSFPLSRSLAADIGVLLEQEEEQ